MRVNIDRTQLYNLLTGVAGIYICYFIGGLLHQSIIKRQHYNVFTQKYQICQYPFGLNMLPIFIAWLMGLVYIKFRVSEPVKIPWKNAAATGLLAACGPFFSLIAIEKTSFPVVTMMQSSSILPVIFVALCCTRVTDQKLKLGPKKIITAGLVALGIIFFQIFDQENQERQTSSDLIGLLCVFLYFLVDGFLPDFQAEIKTKFKPEPVEMMVAVNKWGAFFMFVGSLLTLHLPFFALYLFQHPYFTIQLVTMSLTSGVGQFFVYRMIKQFKQHFVPFTITSRKILTVALNMAFYQHPTNIFQMMGLILCLLTVVVQFLSQIMKKPQEQNKDAVELNEEIPMEMAKQPVKKDGSQQQQMDIDMDLCSDRNNGSDSTQKNQDQNKQKEGYKQMND